MTTIEDAAYKSILEEDYGMAANLYGQLLTMHPNWIHVLINLGTSLSHLNNMDEAAPLFERAKMLMPEDPDVYFSYGSALARNGRTVEAASQFEQAITLAPSNATVHYNLAVARGKLADTGGAMREYETAVSLNPVYRAALWNLGICYFDNNRPEDALAIWKKQRRIDENNPYLLIRIAEAYAALSNSRQAKRHARLATIVSAESGIANRAGMVFHALGAWSPASKLYKLAINRDTEYVEAWVNLGIALDMLGKFQDAQDAYQSAINLRPNDIDAHLDKAVSLKMEGRFEEARIAFRRALEMDPENELARDNLNNDLRFADEGSATDE